MLLLLLLLLPVQVAAACCQQHLGHVPEMGGVKVGHDGGVAPEMLERDLSIDATLVQRLHTKNSRSHCTVSLMFVIGQ